MIFHNIHKNGSLRHFSSQKSIFLVSEEGMSNINFCEHGEKSRHSLHMLSESGDFKNG